MRNRADVKSIDALREAKAALADFRETVNVALGEANADVQRTLWWIQNDQRTHWEHQVRRRTEMVNQAKSDLYRAQLAAMDDRASCLEQRKMLEKAERALVEAHEKLKRVKHWARVLDREIMLYKGQCQGIARAVDSDLPRGEAQLELLMDKLARYLSTAPDRPSSPPVAASPIDTTEPASGDGAGDEKKGNEP